MTKGWYEIVISQNGVDLSVTATLNGHSVLWHRIRGVGVCVTSKYETNI